MYTHFCVRFYVHTFLCKVLCTYIFCEVLCTYIFVYLVKRGVLFLVGEIRRYRNDR